MRRLIHMLLAVATLVLLLPAAQASGFFYQGHAQAYRAPTAPGFYSHGHRDRHLRHRRFQRGHSRNWHGSRFGHQGFHGPASRGFRHGLRQRHYGYDSFGRRYFKYRWH